MLAFIALIHALPTKGRNLHPIHNKGGDAFCNGEILHQGEKKRDTQFMGRT
jgi:hypothetical protein